MIVNKYGRVGGSIDRAQLAGLYAKATDDDLKAHYRQVAAENGLDLEAREPEAEPEAEEPVEVEEPVEEDLDALRAEAEAAGVKVDKRWGVERHRAEIDATWKDEG